QPMNSHPRIVSLVREKIVVEEESAKKEIMNVKGADGKTYKVGIINIPKFYMDFEAYRRRDPNYKSTTRDVRLILDTLMLWLSICDSMVAVPYRKQLI
ncbi:MAG: hypothetical protein ACN6PI_21360, partial [Sphingobacterium siyangense]